MNVEDLRNVYSFTPSMHNNILNVLDTLDDNKPLSYNKRTSKYKVALVLTLILLLSLTTIVATGTNLFGLFSNKSGKYGLNVSVYNEAVDVEIENVKIVLGYIPAGYMQIVDDDGVVTENVYSYGGDAHCLDNYFSYYINQADGYKLQQSFVVESTEYDFAGNKAIIGTQQYEENGNKYYFAVKYFSDFGYVVECYSDNRDELIRIVKNLCLDIEDSTESTVNIKTNTKEFIVDNELTYKISDTFTVVEHGGSFDFTSLVINGVKNIPEPMKKPDNFTIKYKDIKESDNINTLVKSNFLYNGYENNEDYISYFFDSNGYLITPYTRTDRDNGDGIYSLDKTWETTDDRHFYLVTLEVTSNSEYTDFDTSSIWVGTIDETDDGNVDFTYKYGDINLVYIEGKNEFNQIEINKGSTKEIVVGVVVDDDVLDYSFLTFKATTRNVSDDGNKVNDIEKYYCLKLDGGVDYD